MQKTLKFFSIFFILALTTSCFDFFNGAKFDKDTLRHSTIGDFLYEGGGHLQQNVNILDKLGIEYSFTRTFDNGVRVGRVYTHDGLYKDMQSWFPKTWTVLTLKNAVKAVTNEPDNKQILKENAISEKVEISGIYKNVKLIVIIKKIANKENNKIENLVIATYPDMLNQPDLQTSQEKQKSEKQEHSKEDNKKVESVIQQEASDDAEQNGEF